MAEAAEQESYEETLRRDAAEQKAILGQQITEEKGQAAADVSELQRLQQEQKPEWQRFKQKQAELEAVRPPPALERPPPAPRTQQTIAPSSLEKTVGMASIFALLSVGMAKGSAIYGLKALGGFLTGAHAGNLEQADAAIKDFNSEMKRVHDANEYSRQEYLDVFNNKKYTLEMQEHAIHLKALEMKDELMVQARREKGMTGVHDLIRQRAEVDHKMGQEMQRYRQWEETLRQHAQTAKRAEITDAIAQRRLELEEIRLDREKTGKTTPGQERQELTTLLNSYQKELAAAQKKGEHHIFSGPSKEEAKAIEDARKKVDAVQNRLSEMAGLTSAAPPPVQGAKPPAGGKVMVGKVLVRRKSDGKPGVISEKFFDPAKYDRVPDGESVQLK